MALLTSETRDTLSLVLPGTSRPTTHLTAEYAEYDPEMGWTFNEGFYRVFLSQDEEVAAVARAHYSKQSLTMIHFIRKRLRDDFSKNGWKNQCISEIRNEAKAPSLGAIAKH